MHTETMWIESCPDGGFERYTNGLVAITGDVVTLGAGALDRTAKKVIRQSVTDPYEPVKGIARIEWKSVEDRARCIKYQMKRKGRTGTRWDDVERFVELMRSEQWNYFSPGPIFIQPYLTTSAMQRLKSVNGARRIMAHLEAKHDAIDVIVLRPRPRGDVDP